MSQTTRKKPKNMTDHGDPRFLITKIKLNEALFGIYVLNYLEATVKIWVNWGSSIRLPLTSDVSAHDVHFHHSAPGFEPLCNQFHVISRSLRFREVWFIALDDIGEQYMCHRL